VKNSGGKNSEKCIFKLIPFYPKKVRKKGFWTFYYHENVYPPPPICVHPPQRYIGHVPAQNAGNQIASQIFKIFPWSMPWTPRTPRFLVLPTRTNVRIVASTWGDEAFRVVLKNEIQEIFRK
jgi:hypothetical protein